MSHCLPQMATLEDAACSGDTEVLRHLLDEGGEVDAKGGVRSGAGAAVRDRLLIRGPRLARAVWPDASPVGCT